MVFKTTGAILRGVMLIVVSLLTLGANQTAKKHGKNCLFVNLNKITKLDVCSKQLKEKLEKFCGFRCKYTLLKRILCRLLMSGKMK